MKLEQFKPILLAALAQVRATVFTNIGTKAFALAFACAIWIWVNAGEREVQVVYFPLELTGQPEETAVVGDRVDRVAVHLNGPRTLLAPIEANRRAIVLDLSGLQPGEPARLKIRQSMIRIPRGVRVMQIEPSRVTVHLEQLRQVAVRVKVRLKGEVDEFYQLHGSQVSARPKTVVVRGPKSVVEGLEIVETEPVDITGIKTSLQQEVALVAEHLTEVKPPTVEVAVQVVPIISTRVFRKIKVTARDLPEGHLINPDHVELTVKGPAETLKALRRGKIAVFITAALTGGSQLQVPVNVELPSGFELVSVEPPKVDVRLPVKSRANVKPKPKSTKARGVK